MISVFFVEDHEILRDGLKSLLNENREISVVGEAANAKELLDKLSLGKPDIVVADINLPGMSGVELTEQLTSRYPSIKVIALSMLDQKKYLSEMFTAGAKGYLLKSVGKDELIYAIKKVAAGGSYICSEMTMKLMDDTKEEQVSLQKVSLSKRESEILQLIAEGLTNNEIANKLYTSRRTVETHRMNLLGKTGTKNAPALIKFAVLNGLLKN